MENNCCRRCGALLVKTADHAYTCKNNHTIFDSPSPAVGIFFVTETNEVLLSRRGIEPHKGMLDSFGGFVDEGEAFEHAAIRELKEELSLEPGEYEDLRYLTSATGEYPYEGEPLPVLCVFYWTRLTTSRELTASDDVADVVRVPLHGVSLNDLHSEDVKVAVSALRKVFPVAQTQPVA